MLSEIEITRWRTIAPSLVTFDFHDRAVVYGQGDRLASLFSLLKGIVKLPHLTEAGMQLTTDVLGPGSVFGSTLASQVSEHTATSLGEIRVAKITHEDLNRLVGDSPNFAAFFCAEIEAWQILWRGGPGATFGPAPGELVLLADARLVGEPYLFVACVDVLFARDFLQACGEVLWNGPPLHPAL